MSGWKTVRGSTPLEPERLDTTTSKVVNYVRRNIHQIAIEDQLSSGTVTLWEYEEIEIPKEHWSIVAEMVCDESSSIDNLEALTLDLAYQQTLDELGI